LQEGNYIFPVKKLTLTVCDALFITRPVLLIPVWGYFIIGYYRACVFYNSDSLYTLSVLGFSFPVLKGLTGQGTLAGLIMCSLALGGTYILNQLVDIETDRSNAGLPLIAKGGISKKLAGIECMLLCLIPVAYGFFQGRKIFLFFVIILVLTLLYNVRPFYFTGRPFVDFLTNAVGWGLVAFGLGWLYANNGQFIKVKDYLFQAAPYFLFMAAGSINSTIPDVEGDRRTGKVTTVVLLGTRRANLISTASILGALIIAFFNRDPIAILTGLVCIPFFVKYIVTDRLKDGLLTFQLCGGFLMVLVVTFYPWFLLYGLVTYVLTRIYFKVRHNIDYPKVGI
jgi:4-hydroxybenzoate polyprenyltransferase